MADAELVPEAERPLELEAALGSERVSDADRRHRSRSLQLYCYLEWALLPPARGNCGRPDAARDHEGERLFLNILGGHLRSVCEATTDP